MWLEVVAERSWRVWLVAFWGFLGAFGFAFTPNRDSARRSSHNIYSTHLRLMPSA